MKRFGIGVRWWLGAAFALVAAVTAGAVVTIFSQHAQNAFRNRAEELTAGSAFVVAQDVGESLRLGSLTHARLVHIARTRHVSLFLYDRSGRAVAASRPGAPDAKTAAVTAALSGQRYVASSDSGRHVVVAFPLANRRYAGLVVRSIRPDLPAELGIVQDQTLRTALIAVLAGAIVGLLLAQLIALRLRRLAAAAEAIRAGDFETPLGPRFPDEFGSVAAALERMRVELHSSFGKLEFERDRLRLLLERLQEGVVTVDRDLVVQLANPEARRILDGRLREGQPLPGGWPELPLRRLARQLFEADARLEQMQVELEGRRTLAVTAIPARSETDVALLVLVDLTDQERRELSEREFVANAAHELRTPLTTIIGAVEVLQAGAKDDPAERDRFLGHIERESGRLGRLAHALLVLARAQTRSEPPQIERVELRPLLDEIASSLAVRGETLVEVQCAFDVDVPANRGLLEHALRNLAENAAKNTAAGSIVLRATRGDGAVRIEIEDTGSGMTPETQRHVFDRFYRGRGRDPDGFGLGLAIVRQAVGALGGRIELDSEPGSGTRFAIILAEARDVVAA